MYCPNCGNIIDENSKFCRYCGAGISNVQYDKKPAEDQKSESIPTEPGTKVPDDITLLPDEKPVWSGRMSYLSNLGLILLGVLTIWIFGLGLIFILIAVLKVYATEYFVSNKRVHIRYGLVGRRIFDLKSEWITNVTISQGFFGRIANFGNITVSTPGERGGAQRMIGVSDVMRVKALIDRYVVQHNR